MINPTYWTKAEREAFKRDSMPDGHERLGNRTSYLKITPDEMRRILATVEALEKALRDFVSCDRSDDLEHCGYHDHTEEARALLAALEEKPEAKGPSGDPEGVA